MVVRNKYGGYWHKTRSTVDSGGLSIPCMISMTTIFQPIESPLISPCHAIPDITVPTETGDKLMPTQGRGFPGFLPVCMQGIWGWLSSQVCPLPTTWNQQHAPMHMIISHEITTPSKCGGVINVSTITPKILCRDSGCLPSMCGKAGCTPKLETFRLSSKILF